jgi:hypothetical protein
LRGSVPPHEARLTPRKLGRRRSIFVKPEREINQLGSERLAFVLAWTRGII